MSNPVSNARRKAPWPRLLPRRLGVLAATWALAATGDAATETSRRNPLPEYSVVRFTTDDGLPQHEISALGQTRNGYLWIGTWFGLARYDGVRFTVFDKFNTPSLSSDAITATCEDSRNRLWVGSAAGVTCIFGTNTVGFTNIAGRALGNVACMIPARDGGVWVGCDGGLARLGSESPPRFIVDSSAASAPVQALVERGDGRLMACTAAHWLELDPTTEKLRDPSIEMSPANSASVIAVDPASGHHWSAANNAVHLKTETGWERKFEGPANEPLDFVQLHVDGHGQLWAVIRPLGVVRWNGTTFAPPPVDDPELLRRANCILEDHEGSLWIGTSDGLMRLHPRQAFTYSQHDGLADDSVWSVAESPDGTIWAGTQHGLNAIRGGEVKVHYRDEIRLRREIRAVVADRNGDIWYAQERVNLFRYAPGKSPQPVEAAGVAGRSINALYRDIEGAIWIGSSEGPVRLENGVPAPVPGLEALAGKDVRAVLRNRAGDLWFGTAADGLWRLRNGNARHFTTAEGLSADDVWALHEDADGSVWAGTAHGLNRIKDDEVSSFTTRDGLVENLVNQILEDDSGSLWLAGLRGIHRIRRADLEGLASGTVGSVRCVTLSAADGLESSETNGETQPAGCRAADGRLWFPTTRGVAVIDPRAVRENRTPPPVVIERILVKGPKGLSAFGDTLSHGLFWEGPNGISIPPGGAEMLEIRYTAPSFIQSGNVHFRYRLRGHDKGWHDAGTGRLALYTNLGPGDYAFEVKAANSHGYESAATMGVPVHVAPHVYETLAFWLYALAAAMAGGALFYRSRLKNHRHHLLAEIAALERERTRIAKDLHDDVGANLTGLALQAELASRDLSGSGELRRQLTSFVQESRALVDRMREVIWAVNPECDSFESLVHYLTHHTENFLGAGGLLCRLDLPDSLPARYIRAEVRHELLLVLKEALANTVKHSGADEVRVRIALDGNRLVLTIRDNGHGFDGPDAPMVRRVGSGHGLTNMRDRITAIGGRLRFQTGRGQGTEIAVEIPLDATLAPNSAKRRTRKSIAVGEDLHAFRNGKESPTPS